MGKKIEDYHELPNFERKQIPTFIKQHDDEKGIVEHYVAIIGNVDEGMDRIMPGAFSKSINERGLRVKALDQHSQDSVTRIVGKPLSMREVGRGELSQDVLDYAPDASGALLVTTQYAIDTTRGRDVFRLVKGGYAPESSIGYDALDVEYVFERDREGKEQKIRQLKTIRLWEYSNVVFGMNQGTAVLSAKEKEDKEDKGEPSEGKPYGVFMDGDQHCVYKLDEDSERTGESLGCHDAEDDAMAQMRALYAEEKDAEDAEGEEAQDEKEMTPHGPVQRLGDVLQGSIHQTFTMMADSYYIQGLLDREERIMLSSLIGDALDILTMGIPEEVAMREISGMGMYMMSKPIDLETKAGRVLARRNADRIMNAMNLLHEALTDAGLMEMPEEEDEDKSTTAPEEAADKQQDSDTQAGPDTPPTSKELELIEISLRELELLEV